MVVDFLDRDSVIQALVESGFGSPRFGEGLAADDLAWSFITDADVDEAAAFVGQRDAVIGELV